MTEISNPETETNTIENSNDSLGVPSSGESIAETAENNNENEKTPAAPAVDQATLSVMVEALKAHEAASDLNNEILEDICVEAFAAGKLNDVEWLGQKLKEVTGQEVDLNLNDLSATESTEAEDTLEQIQISQTATIETEEDMKEVLRLHEIWMNSVLRPRSDITGDRANLRGANLSGFDLTGVDLRCADFRNATMIGTNLHSAQLSNAWLQGAILQGANLTKANLKRAKLDGTDLREADLTEVDRESADFSKAILKGNRPAPTPEPVLETAQEIAVEDEDLADDQLEMSETEENDQILNDTDSNYDIDENQEADSEEIQSAIELSASDSETDSEDSQPPMATLDLSDEIKDASLDAES